MSRILDALRQLEGERAGADPLVRQKSILSADLLGAVETGELQLSDIRFVRPAIRPECRLVALSTRPDIGAEKFRLLAVHLKGLQAKLKLKTILVTSSVCEEGKSTVATNLTLTLARHTRQKILLLEGDLRRPQLGTLLGLGSLKGLSDWIRSKDPITKYLYRLTDSHLYLLPAGTPMEQPSELLQVGQIKELLEQMAHWFDWIVIDSPPLLPLVDAHIWAGLSDGILVVVREGKTPRNILQKTLEGLGGSVVLGVVLNEATGDDYGYYGHYYGPKAKVSRKQGNQSTLGLSL